MESAKKTRTGRNTKHNENKSFVFAPSSVEEMMCYASRFSPNVICGEISYAQFCARIVRASLMGDKIIARSTARDIIALGGIGWLITRDSKNRVFVEVFKFKGGQQDDVATKCISSESDCSEEG